MYYLSIIQILLTKSMVIEKIDYNFIHGEVKSSNTIDLNNMGYNKT